MRRTVLLLTCLVVVLLVPMAVFASSYRDFIPIRVWNNSTSTWENVPILIGLNSAVLVELGFKGSEALDTDFFEGALRRPYSVAADRVGVFVPQLLPRQTRFYDYRLGVGVNQAGFPLMVGLGGSVSIPDDPSLELGNNFSVKQTGWVDTTAVNQSLIYKPGAFRTWISADGTISSRHWFKGPARWASMLVDGDSTPQELNRIVGATTQWEAVLSHDGDASYLGTTLWNVRHASWFTLENPTLGPSPSITSVIVLASGRRTSVDDPPDAQTRVGARLGGVEVWGPLTELSATYSSVSYTFSSRPGGGSWSLADLDALEVAICTKETVGNHFVRFTRLNVWVLYEATLADPVVSASGLTSGEMTVETLMDGANLRLLINGVEKDSVPRTAGTIDTVHPWTIMAGDSIRYMNRMEIEVGGVRRLWYEPNRMIQTANVVDRSGHGNTGTITWGTNPAGVEVTVKGVRAAVAAVPPGAEDPVPPEVIPLPGTLELFVDPAVTGEGMLLFDLFERAAGTLGWTTAILYSVMMLILAVAFGFAAMVATGSMFGFALGFGITAATAGGTGLFPWWIALLSVLVVLMGGYVWSRLSVG